MLPASIVDVSNRQSWYLFIDVKTCKPYINAGSSTLRIYIKIAKNYVTKRFIVKWRIVRSAYFTVSKCSKWYCLCIRKFVKFSYEIRSCTYFCRATLSLFTIPATCMTWFIVHAWAVRTRLRFLLRRHTFAELIITKLKIFTVKVQR